MGKAVMAIVPVVVIGAVLGLGAAGIINIPGVSPKKALKNAANIYGQKDDKLAAKTTAPPPTPAVTTPKKEEPKKQTKTPKPDFDQGAESLATVWNEIKTPELLAISKNWKDAELVRVLAHMDTSKVAKYLELMATGNPDSKDKGDALRASKLSKILQDQGSVVKSGETT